MLDRLRSRQSTRIISTINLCHLYQCRSQNFAISWKASYPHLAYLPCSQQGTLYVDGARCATRIMRQHTNHEIVPTIKGIDTSPTTQRPLLFSKMELTGKAFTSPTNTSSNGESHPDDDAYLHSATTELGDIKLEMTEVKVFDSRLADSGNETPDLQQKIHERSKKGSTHCVRYMPHHGIYVIPISENLKPWKRNLSTTFHDLKC